MFGFNKESELQKGISLIYEGKPNEAKEIIESISPDDKDYPRARYNLFSLCSSGLLGGHFYIDEAVEHLKESYDYKHELGRWIYPIIENVEKGSCGSNFIAEFIQTRYKHSEVIINTRKGNVDPILTAILCLWTYKSPLVHKCLDEFWTLFQKVSESIIQNIDEIADHHSKGIFDYESMSEMFNSYIFFPVINRYPEFDSSNNPTYDPDGMPVQYAYCFFILLHAILYCSSSKEITLLYLKNVRNYISEKIGSKVFDSELPFDSLEDLFLEKDPISKIISQYSFDKVCKAFAYFVIDPYIRELQTKHSYFVQLSVEKFLRDQFDGMYDSGTSDVSTVLTSFYRTFLVNNHDKFNGALDHKAGLGIDEFNDGNDGPAKRLQTISYSLQRTTGSMKTSIDITVGIVSYIYNVYMEGLFLPYSRQVYDKSEIMKLFVPVDACYEADAEKFDFNFYEKQCSSDYPFESLFKDVSVDRYFNVKERFFESYEEIFPILQALIKELNFG